MCWSVKWGYLNTRSVETKEVNFTQRWAKLPIKLTVTKNYPWCLIWHQRKQIQLQITVISTIITPNESGWTEHFFTGIFPAQRVINLQSIVLFCTSSAIAFSYWLKGKSQRNVESFFNAWLDGTTAKKIITIIQGLTRLTNKPCQLFQF